MHEENSSKSHSRQSYICWTLAIGERSHNQYLTVQYIIAG